jgi:hypothetical protein
MARLIDHTEKSMLQLMFEPAVAGIKKNWQTMGQGDICHHTTYKN